MATCLLDAGRAARIETEGLSNSQADFTPYNGEASEEVDDSSDSSSVSSLEISDEEDMDQNRGERKEAHGARERQQVLQAAGLIITADAQPPQVSKRRRPAPAAPQRSSVTSSTLTKDLPPVPDVDLVGDAGIWVDDAFDRYEAFKHAHGTVNRLSMASIDTAPTSPGASSIAPSLSRDSESRGHSTFLHFLGRRTPPGESDKRSMPNISGPIAINPTSPSRGDSPAFGTVGVFFSLHVLAVALHPWGHSVLSSRGQAWWTRQSLMSFQQTSVEDKR